MNVDSLRKLLEENEIGFEILSNEKAIYSAQDGADYFDIEIGQTAPAIIIQTEKGLYCIIISGERGRIDFEEIKQVLEVSSVKLASKDSVKQKTGFNPGSIPLVGTNLPCVIDNRLLKYDFVYGGSGQAACTLKISPRDLEKLNEVVGKIY